MTGFLSRLSDIPPKVATNGFFPSRGILNLKFLRGPLGVFVVDLSRLTSLITLVLFLDARVFRSDVSIIHRRYPRCPFHKFATSDAGDRL